MANTVTEDGKERKVYVYAHNMRGFDSSFILTVLYKMGYKAVKMTEKRRKEFLTWHKEKVESNAVFDFQKELSAYLRSDVEVPNGLLAAFSEEMVELTGIDLVTQDYRQHCVPGVEENVSRKKFTCPRTKKWMAATSDESEQRGHRLQYFTAIKIYTVDGYDAETKTVYEYHGCFFHGCKKCFPIQRQKTHNCHPDRTIEETYEATLKRTAILQAAGYTVIEKWGCEFNHDKKTDPELQTFLESFEMVPPLEPRDAFFGGRTGAT
ncbi:unnamed protein product, partial [Porites evermanni]